MVEASPTVHFSLFPTPLGDCGIAWCGDMVVATRLPDQSSAETSRKLAARTGGARGEPPPSIQRAIEAMTALLEGEPTDLTFIACDFGGAEPFAVEVYAATRAIPAGETSTYGAIASQLGDKQLSRSVGQALGRNPVPIIVPCHRVIGAGGKLTGFSAAGGVATKLRMLAIEGAQIGEAPGLFGDLPLATKPQ
ncbi:methylated-DNA--[protein]-cysteine S-methyltransferase [uncultured Hoeflea sp.]|uniref:methylated-DNA--[protein]-cysteine S-methyltransferase n=1 Tax=uncultured Hoeflea sp. TaxID=538666 RepID=UPI00261FE1F0|nr:methylated-DNA--[protein]-cysteine S-methyltransferase [uncultured Hoeflea sp.]